MKRHSSSRSGTGQMAVMASCYALGTFADNFYKQAAVLMAAALQMSAVQSWATVLFSLPFVLFSAWAGWLADKAPKRNIVIAAKALELLAMLAGVWMLITVSWTGILLVMFVMASQAALFSPAINGAIPENFPVADVPKVNGLTKAASTAAILAGMALAGLFLDLRPQCLAALFPGLTLQDEGLGRASAALFVAALSCLGLGTALLLSPKAAARTTRPFPLAGPLDSLRHTLECRKDPPLFLVIMAGCWFYGIAVLAVISIANLAAALGYSNSAAGAMSAVLMVGVAAGSLRAGKADVRSWRRLLTPSACGIGLLLVLCAFTPLLPGALQGPWIFSSLFLCGLCGGIYLIPLESYIQVRPAPADKGKIIAASNFATFTAMALFGALFLLIGLLPPALTFAVYGAATIAFALLFIRPRLARLGGDSLKEASASPLGISLRSLLRLRYDLRGQGLEEIPAPKPGESGILFLANHPSYLDPLIVWGYLAGLRPRPLADSRQISGPVQRFAGKAARAITLPDLGLDGKKGAAGVRTALDECAKALNRGEHVLLFPAGRASRDGQEHIGSNSAVYRLLQAAPGARVILARVEGMWGSSFGYASGAKPDFIRVLLHGAAAILANGLLFTPRRKVAVTFAEPPDLPRNADKLTLNRYLEDFFRPADSQPVRVRRFFWQRRGKE